MSPLNYVVLGVYLLGLVYIGWRLAGRQKSTEDYFLAGRNMPWWAVAMSMYASLTSAVTYMGLPGLAYRSNVTLIAVCVVSPLLAPILIYVFYPHYRKLHVTTSYEYIHARYGQAARLTVAALFMAARLGWLGTVIFAPALALSVATGLSLSVAIILMGVLATAYTVLGGLSAVIWTDVVQFIILIGGAFIMAFVLIHDVPGGITAILDTARASGHLHFNMHLNLFEMTIPIVVVSFFLSMMQDYGTDQVTVQRLLSVRTFRGMAKAVSFNACTDAVIVALLLFIGLGLFAYYQQHAVLLPEQISGDQVLPYFIIHRFPNGLSGLLIAAIFAAAMSSMDSGINSMATVIVSDFIRPFRRCIQDNQEQKDVRLARILTLILGVVATGVAFVVTQLEGIIEAFATFMSLFSAPVLALFLVGIMTKWGRFGGWCIAMGVSVGVTFAVQRLTAVNWIYYFPISFFISLVLTLVFSPLYAKTAILSRKLHVFDRFRKI